MMKIIRADETHLDAITALEEKCFSTPWSRASLESELYSSDARFLAAVDGGKVVGFAVFHRLCDEGEIFNVAVDENRRGEGIGRALIADILAAAPKMGVSRIFLEVRESNTPARGLYSSCGFQVCGLRKNYYEAPTENAVLMEAEIKC